MTRITLDISKEDLTEAISNMDHSEIIGLVLAILGEVACVEVDEELVARMWPAIAGCYTNYPDELPTLASLMRQYGTDGG